MGPASTIYEPCRPDGEGHHDCIGKGYDEDGVSSPNCTCTCHRGVIVTNTIPEDTVQGLKYTFFQEGVKGVIVLLSAANVLGAVGRHLGNTQ